MESSQLFKLINLKKKDFDIVIQCLLVRSPTDVVTKFLNFVENTIGTASSVEPDLDKYVNILNNMIKKYGIKKNVILKVNRHLKTNRGRIMEEAIPKIEFDSYDDELIKHMIAHFVSKELENYYIPKEERNFEYIASTLGVSKGSSCRKDGGHYSDRLRKKGKGEIYFFSNFGNCPNCNEEDVFVDYGDDLFQKK